MTKRKTPENPHRDGFILMALTLCQGWRTLYEATLDSELAALEAKMMAFLETEFDLKRRIGK